jgi:hypothetical protein
MSRRDTRKYVGAGRYPKLLSHASFRHSIRLMIGLFRVRRKGKERNIYSKLSSLVTFLD